MLASSPADEGSSPMSRSRVRRFAAAAGAVVVAAAVVAVTASTPAVGQPGGFGDVAEDAYYSVPVSTLAEFGVFVGTECQAGFCPGDPIDRKTMAVWIVRVLDGEDPEAVSESRFDDVDASGFHAPFIERMAELEVTRGCGDRAGFCPDRNVTRAEMAVFLSRAYKLPEGPDPGFVDVPADAWYAADVAKLAASEITVGCGDRSGFCPGRDTTRAQMATFLHRAEQRSEPGGAFKAVSAGSQHTCAIRSDDTLACWGNNRQRQADPPDRHLQSRRRRRIAYMRHSKRRHRRLLGIQHRHTRQPRRAGQPPAGHLQVPHDIVLDQLRDTNRRHHRLLGKQQVGAN